MGRILRNKPTTDPGTLDPREFSPCHSRRYSCGDIMVIRPDFTNQAIGRALYCEKTDYSDGVNACYRVHPSIIKFRDWPDGLSQQVIMNLIDRQGTTHWLNSGFHILFHLGQWDSFKKYSGIPPFDQNRPGLSEMVIRHLRAIGAQKTQGRAIFGADRATPKDNGDIPFDGQEDAF